LFMSILRERKKCQHRSQTSLGIYVYVWYTSHIFGPQHEVCLLMSSNAKTGCDTSFLCIDYFSQHIGEYLNVLSALEKLNVAILKAMYKTKAEYQNSSVLGQFVTRFLLRETSTQLLSLQRSLQCAMEAVDEESAPSLSVSALIVFFFSFHSTWQVQHWKEAEWNSQIGRLQLLLDKLDAFILLSRYQQNILLVQRKMAVNKSDLDNFRKVLKSYVDATSAHPDNLQSVPEKSSYVIYEFWRDRLSWMRSVLALNVSKAFQRCVINMLEDTEIVSTMLLPGGDIRQCVSVGVRTSRSPICLVYMFQIWEQSDKI
uniref:N-terminal EF-hand calcium binding protein 3 n=1 Tax=Hippocampus comes TaxID=109280 RepID=A0A3Q3DG33_HIPCM